MVDLLHFYGRECSHCKEMEPLVKRLEKETKKKVKRIEVWHSAKNAELFDKYAKGKCSGVPFFYNTKTKKHICGSTSYDHLKNWALG